MKRFIFALTAAGIMQFANSQTVFEASRFSQSDIKGTARYMGVAGAFGALGGDVSAIKDNPAGLGVFRKSELTATLGAGMMDVNSNWYDKESNENALTARINNFGLVFASKTWRAESGYTGLLSSNFSFTYNKVADFYRNTNIRGASEARSMTDYLAVFTGTIAPDKLNWDNYPMGGYSSPYLNPALPWMSVMAYNGGLIREDYGDNNTFKGYSSLLNGGEKVTPSYRLRERGGIDEYSLGWSGNFSNRFYVGATFNWKNLDYSSSSAYSEVYQDGGDATVANRFSTSGRGFDLSLGIIAVPVDFLRLGVSVRTPTFYDLQQWNYASISFNNDRYSGDSSTPDDNYVDYSLQTPLQLNVSAAFISGKKGFVSAEYVYRDYRNMKFTADDFDYSDSDNQDINGMLKNSRTIKIGGEYRLTDNVSLRGGYANISSLTNSTATKILPYNTARTDPEYFTHDRSDYFALGLGYRESNWYADFTYSNTIQKGQYWSYNPADVNPVYAAEPADLKTKNQNLTLTFGLRF